MCKESQRPLHRLKSLWPGWSPGAAGHGLVSRGSTFSTASLGRGVAETSFRSLAQAGMPQHVCSDSLNPESTLHTRNKHEDKHEGKPQVLKMQRERVHVSPTT
ncbi:unnamed protein product [Rangifer tarandus platyrhynchus]|uniref:Uncharacterized protein n=1 Tax=Rangifer tarandus platyrhynchus TaxID=3082113 RepID=A0ACB1KFX6_RANTA